MPGICATNVPYRTEQTEWFLRAGSIAVSSLSAKWMKTQFGLPHIGSAEGRPQSDLLAGNWTARRPLPCFASAFQSQDLLHQSHYAEHGMCYPVPRTTHVSSPATEPDELESLQPSMLCNRLLPIYFSDDRALPPTSNE
jgi:hypothetical protein